MGIEAKMTTLCYIEKDGVGQDGNDQKVKRKEYDVDDDKQGGVGLWLIHDTSSLSRIADAQGDGAGIISEAGPQ